MRNQVWDSTLANLNSLDLAEFVLCLGGFDAVDSESSLGVVDQTEVFASLVNRDDILETRRVGVISSHFAVDLDQALRKDSSRLSAVQRILQTVADEDNQGQAVAGFLLSCQSVVQFFCPSEAAVGITHMRTR